MIKITLQDLARIACESKQDLQNAAANVGRESKVFLHWSAGHYGQPFNDYHINIDHDGSIYIPVENLAEVLEHTWHHNTGCIGVSMLCCAFATTNNLGQEPPTEQQIETMAQVIAVLTKYLEIPLDDCYVRTHAEQANEDGYGPAQTWERWDLWLLHDGDEMGSGGNVLRGKANWYLQYGNI